MRPVALALLMLAATGARAEGPIPITVLPFSARCFDAAKLAGEVRARAGEVPVAVGKPPRGSHQQVRVVERGDGLSVEVTARDARGRVIGSARRVIPTDDCATALEVAGLIVARAALPLAWHEPEPHAPPPRPRHPLPGPTLPASGNPPSTSEGNTSANASGDANASAPKAATTPKTTPPKPPEAAPEVPPEPTLSTPRPPSAFDNGPPLQLRPSAPPRRDPDTVVLRFRGPDRRWVGELAAAVYGSFALDGGPQNPGGELAIGFRRRHFGAAVRGSIERDSTIDAKSSAGTLSLSLRRAAVSVEAHADIGVRVGFLRIVVGPMLPLWIARAGGLPHPRTVVVTSFAVDVRLLYHLDLGRVFLGAGVDFQVAPTSEDLSVTGVGVIGHTPRLTIGPILALGLNL